MRTSVLTTTTVFMLLSAAANAASDDLVVRESRYSVQQTADRLVAALQGKGIVPVARIDHAAAAKASGLELPPTQVVLFGKPELGTPLMQAEPKIAIDLPMRMLVWQDATGKVRVAYTKADALSDRYAITGKARNFSAMASALEAFAKAATE